MAKFSLMTFNMTKELVRKKLTVRQVLQVAADTGVPCVDLRWVSPKSVPEYRAAMEATGVKVCCYISGISFLGKEKAIRSSLEKEMAVAKALDAKLFMIVPYDVFLDCRKARKMGRTAVRERMVQYFRLAVEMGKEHGLEICFETTPDDVICLSGTEDCRYVLDRVPGLGLVFDTANMLPHGDETLSSYEALKDRIVHVHLKDVALTNEKPGLFQREVAADGRLMKATCFGQGVIPVKEVYDRMGADGYTGTFAIEYIRPKEAYCSRGEHSNHLRKYLEYLTN